jgi:hypothetical protein
LSGDHRDLAREVEAQPHVDRAIEQRRGAGGDGLATRLVRGYEGEPAHAPCTDLRRRRIERLPVERHEARIGIGDARERVEDRRPHAIVPRRREALHEPLEPLRIGDHQRCERAADEHGEIGVDVAREQVRERRADCRSGHVRRQHADQDLGELGRLLAREDLEQGVDGRRGRVERLLEGRCGRAPDLRVGIVPQRAEDRGHRARRGQAARRHRAQRGDAARCARIGLDRRAHGLVEHARAVDRESRAP